MAGASSDAYALGLCARAMPFDLAVRRGLRAPDVAAIAVAKRAFLQKVIPPHALSLLLTGPRSKAWLTGARNGTGCHRMPCVKCYML